MLEMLRQPPRRDQHRVDADVVARSCIARHQIFRRRRDAHQPLAVEREIERGLILRAFTSTKATSPGLRITISTSPAGVRTRRSRIVQPLRRRKLAAMVSASLPRASAACRFTP